MVRLARVSYLGCMGFIFHCSVVWENFAGQTARFDPWSCSSPTAPFIAYRIGHCSFALWHFGLHFSCYDAHVRVQMSCIYAMYTAGAGVAVVGTAKGQCDGCVGLCVEMDG
jgi:hypothetical protein